MVQDLDSVVKVLELNLELNNWGDGRYFMNHVSVFINQLFITSQNAFINTVCSTVSAARSKSRKFFDFELFFPEMTIIQSYLTFKVPNPTNFCWYYFLEKVSRNRSRAVSVWKSRDFCQFYTKFSFKLCFEQNLWFFKK